MGASPLWAVLLLRAPVGPPPILQGGQPGGRSGCCYKSSAYLDSLSSSRTGRLDARVATFISSREAWTRAESLRFADERTAFTARPVRVGDLHLDPVKDAACVKLLSLARLLDLDTAGCLGLWGCPPTPAQGTERAVFAVLCEGGLEAVHWPQGPALAWKDRDH